MCGTVLCCIPNKAKYHLETVLSGNYAIFIILYTTMIIIIIIIIIILINNNSNNNNKKKKNVERHIPRHP